jgi:hypothetical protein
MRKIYQGAKRGVVWLGELHEDGGLGIGAIKKLLGLVKNPKAFNREEILAILALFNPGSDSEFNTTWAALNRMFTAPWFDRVWTIQEAVLPRIITILYGPEEFDWDKLYEAFCAVDTNLPVYATVTIRHFMKLGELRIHVQQQLWKPFPSLLLDFHSKSASDERDRIFATFGLLQDNGPYNQFLSPNYHPPASEIYTTTMATVIRVQQHLSFLKLVMHRSKRTFGLRIVDLLNKDDSLPSWVINWPGKFATAIGGYDPSEIPLLENMIFLSTGASRHIPAEPSSRNQLKVRGMQVDEILYISGPLRCLDGETYNFPDWLFFIMDCDCKGSGFMRSNFRRCWRFIKGRLHRSYFGMDKESKIFYEVISAGTTDKILGARERFKPTAESFSNVLRGLKLLSKAGRLDGDQYTHFERHPEDSATYFSILAKCQDRKIAMTKHGRIGLVPDCADVGDPIFLLMGGDVPFMLRAADESTWTLLGHCFVHGIMDGEAFDEQKCESIALV